MRRILLLWCCLLILVVSPHMLSSAALNLAYVGMIHKSPPTLRLFELAKLADKSNARVCVGIALYYLRQNSTLAALAELEQAAAKTRIDAQAQLLLGSLYNDLGQESDALIHWRLARAGPLFYQRGIEMYVKGEIDQSISLYQTATKINPDLVAAWERLGALYEDLGQVQMAAESWAKAATLRPVGSSDAFWALGESKRLNGDWESAIQAYSRGVAVAPNDTRFYIHLGRAYYYGRHDLLAAVAEIEKATKLRPDVFWYYADVGNLWREAGYYGEATIWYEKARRVAPYEGQPLYLLGVNAMAQDNPAVAVEYLQEAILLATDTQLRHSIYVGLGRAYAVLGYTENACSSWNLAQDLSPAGGDADDPDLRKLCNSSR